jgi:hypothetical protein
MYINAWQTVNNKYLITVIIPAGFCLPVSNVEERVEYDEFSLLNSLYIAF